VSLGFPDNTSVHARTSNVEVVKFLGSWAGAREGRWIITLMGSHVDYVHARSYAVREQGKAPVEPSGIGVAGDSLTGIFFVNSIFAKPIKGQTLVT